MPQYTLTSRAAMSIIIVCFGVMTSMMALTNPLGEAPDEPAHMHYVQFLAHTQRLPQQCASPCVSDVPGEGHQPPLAYAVAALVTWPWITSDETWQTPAPNPDFVWNGGTSPQAYIHGTQEHWPWQGMALAWRIARMLSVAWVLIALWFIAQSAQQLYDSITALVSIALLCATPQLAFIASTVSNDALLLCLASISLYLALRVESWRGLAVLSLVMALALMTKQNAIVLTPLAAWVVWRQWRGWQRILAAFVVAIMFASVLGWWYVRNYQLYGDLLGYTLFEQTYRTNGVDLGDVSTWGIMWQQLVRTAWGVFGWNTVPLPNWWYLVGATVSVLVLTGVALRMGTRPLPRTHWWVLGGIVLVSLAWLIVLALTVGSVAWQSRLIIMAVPAIALLAGRSITWMLPVHSPRMVLLASLAISISTTWLWHTAVLPSYPLQMPTRAQTNTALDINDGAYYTFKGEPGRIVIMDRSHPDTSTIGATIPVRIRWLVAERPYRVLDVSLRWRDQQKKVRAESRWPIHPTIASPLFTVNDRFVGVYNLPVPADLPAGTYTILLSLIDQQTQQRAVLRLVDDRFMGNSVFLPIKILSQP